MSKTAIILGSSGLTGGLLLEKLLADERYSSVKLFSRKASGIDHPKVKEYVVDLFQLGDYAADVKGDEVYCCIGTTKKKTPDQAAYHKIDFGIPVATAKLCAANNIEKNSGLESLKKALGFRLYAFVNQQEIRNETDNSFEFYMVDCRVQSARKRKNMPLFPCKEVGIIEYTLFASTIDERIKTEVICCPPDKEAGVDFFCGWKFYI